VSTISGLKTALATAAERISAYPGAIAILASGLALASTLAAYQLTLQSEAESHKRAIASEASRIAETIVDTMRGYGSILRASAGFVAANGRPNEVTWRTFTSALEIERSFPGVQGLGYVDVGVRDELERIAAAKRSRGRTDFQFVTGDGERDLYTMIAFLAPEDERNRRALGFDMYSEKTRREAMQKARDTGELVLSPIVILRQEISADIQPGSLGYLPVYRDSGTPPTSTAERRAQLMAFVYGVFRWGDFIDRTLQKHHRHSLGLMRIEISGNADAAGGGLIYDSEGGSARPSQTRYTTTVPLDLGGLQWSLTATSNHRFESTLDWSKPRLILSSGLVVTALIATMIVALSQSRERTEIARRKLESEVVQRKEAEERAHLANGELIHRVKNTLAVVSALASQTARHSTSVQAFTASFRERLVALASVQDLLRPDPAYAPELGELVRQSLKAFADAAKSTSASPRLTASGPKVALPGNQAVLLSLLLNELATNATKYGAWSASGGGVTVEWSLETLEEEKLVVLRWTETGSRIKSEPSPNGFGTKVIEAVERGMRGRIERSWPDSGLAFVFRFPVIDPE